MLKQSLLQAIKTHKHLLIAGVVAYLVLLLIMPNFGHAWDCACWGMWATRMNSNGLASAYTEGSTVNYLPLYLYVLRAYAWLVGTEHIYPYIYTLKIVTLLFDVGSAMIISSYFKHQKRAWQYVVFTLLNIGFIYNTLIWNQVDGIWSFFVLAAFTMGYRKHLSGSMLLFILAVNVKLQAIIFLPLLGLMWLPLCNWRNLTKALLISIGVQLLILAPFIAAGVAGNITDVISGSVDYYQSVSMNAFNFWYLVLDGDLMFVKDDILIGGLITYKQAGLLMFFSFSFLVLLPIIKDTWRVIVKKQLTQLRLSQWIWSMTLIPLIFFYFNTQMHERYIHPAIGFATLLAFSTRQFGPWLLMSIAYALSLESICKFLELNNYGTLIFHPDFLAGLYGVSLAWWATFGIKNQFIKKAI
jgi:Gpi18-like mannosyltransferase